MIGQRDLLTTWLPQVCTQSRLYPIQTGRSNFLTCQKIPARCFRWDSLTYLYEYDANRTMGTQVIADDEDE